MPDMYLLCTGSVYFVSVSLVSAKKVCQYYYAELCPNGQSIKDTHTQTHDGLKCGHSYQEDELYIQYMR